MKPLLVSILAFCGCSNPAAYEKSPAGPTAQVAPSNPAFDFGTAELSPANGTGTDATFKVIIKPSSKRPSLFGLLINDHQNGGNACYVFRNLVSNDDMLVADSGSGSIPLAKQTFVANAQCELLRDGTGSTEDTSGLVLTFHIHFLPTFRGTRQIWMVPEDGVGNSPGMKLAGSWIVQ